MGENLLNLRVVARVLIHNQAGELLLCRSQDGKAWVPPGGTVDPGETLGIAALREAEEEAGLKVRAGRLVYLQEFVPKKKAELVMEVAFQAKTEEERPDPSLVASGVIRPSGKAERPWGAWYIKDIGGPEREVRWFTQAEVQAEADPIYPDFLRERYWQVLENEHNPYLGVIAAK